MSSAAKSGRGSFPSISGTDRFWLSLVNRKSGSEPDFLNAGKDRLRRPVGRRPRGARCGDRARHRDRRLVPARPARREPLLGRLRAAVHDLRRRREQVPDHHSDPLQPAQGLYTACVDPRGIRPLVGRVPEDEAMNRPVDLDLRALGPAWSALRKASGNRIGPIRARAQYERMYRLLQSLVEIVGDDERHELADLLDLVGDLIEAYESAHVEIPDTEPPAVLRLLMEQHGLKQRDLPDIAPQSVISEILAGKRRINARQAKALAGRFGVSAAVFL